MEHSMSISLKLMKRMQIYKNQVHFILLLHGQRYTSKCKPLIMPFYLIQKYKMNNQTIPQMLFHDVQMLKKSGVLLVLQVAKMFIKDRA